MEMLNDILSRLEKATGMPPVKKMTEQEYTEFKCDSYNQLNGRLNETDNYNCSICRNKGYIAKARQNENGWYEVHCECKCMKTRAAIMRIIRSGLAKVIKDCTFEKYIVTSEWQKTLKEKAYEYYKNPVGWFYIGGQSGSGKSHLCTAISGALLKTGKEVTYMRWRDDVTKLKSLITDASAYEKMINNYKNAEILYIDDLFKNGKGNNGEVQMPTASDIQTAFEIINYRSNNKLNTIISSEREIEELVQIDEATAGRIIEMSFDNGYGFNIKKDISKNHRLKNIVNL